MMAMVDVVSSLPTGLVQGTKPLILSMLLNLLSC